MLETPSVTLESHRQQFPALANKAYFNYGGQGPMPQTALDAIYQAYQYIQNSGPFSVEMYRWVVQQTNQTRQAIATELGVSAERITITENVTVGCNIALWGIEWQNGDHILISDCEHPGIIATVREINRRFGVEVTTCQLIPTLNEGDPVAAITQEMKPHTKLVVLSHILWNTGQVLPLKEIAQACKSICPSVRILVDAAQSVGVLPLNLDELGVDFYAFTGHKWWCGPEGVGGLYVHADALESLHPTFIGWRSVEFDSSSQINGWKADGRKYEVATSAYPLYLGLHSAIATQNQWGSQQQRYQQILHLSKYLWERLNTLDQVHCLRTSPPESGLVSFQLSDRKYHLSLVKFLEERGFLVRTIKEPDCVRACVHYLTLVSEIDDLITAISSFEMI